MERVHAWGLARTGGFPYNSLDFSLPMRHEGRARVLGPRLGRFPKAGFNPGGREVTMRKFFGSIAILMAALFISLAAWPAAAQSQQQSQQPSYSIPEYNTFQGCRSEKDPHALANCLDDFVTRYPTSTLMPYVYQLYIAAYGQLKDNAKVIEYTDKLVAMGDKADLSARLQASLNRVQAFSASFDPKAPDATTQLAKERDAALQGAKLLQQLPKPANSTQTDEQFADQKKPGFAFFQAAAGFADFQLKDYAAAVEAFKSALANKPDDAASEYRLGLSYLAMNPPQSLDGFWALARSIDLKVPEADKVQDYLKKTILNYEQLTCDNLVDDQLNELLQLAANAPERPSTYSIPSAADLQKIAQASTILTVISDLSGGGDNAKMTWLAICGAEFPDVVGKIIDEKKGDGFIDFLVFTGQTEQEMQAATTANMDVKVWTSTPPAGTPAVPGASGDMPAPQPDVERLQKDDGIRFSGTIVAYDPSPFLLHWDKVKVDPSIIPEKSETGKHHAVPHKTPGT